jgi:hypothetical protein
MSNCDNCTVCKREGLLILPVRPSLVDAQRHARHVPRLDAKLGGELSGLAWQGLQPTTRLIRQGYIHVFYKSTSDWDFYEVTPNGYLNRASSYGALATKKTPPVPFVCSRAGGNVPASTIGIRNALEETEVWIAFADHLWGRTTLGYYAGDESARKLRMSLVKPKAWIESGTMPDRAMVITGENLQKHIPEYADKAHAEQHIYPTIFGMPGKVENPNVDHAQPSTVLFDTGRLDKAKEFAKRCRDLEDTAPSKKLKEKSLILLLDDPIGLGESAGYQHLLVERQQEAWDAGGPQVTGSGDDKDRPWKRQSKVQWDMLEQWVKFKINTQERKRLQAGEPSSLNSYMQYARNFGWPAGTRWEATPAYQRGQVQTLPADSPPQQGVAYDHKGKPITLTDGILRSTGGSTMGSQIWGTIKRTDTEIERKVATDTGPQDRLKRYQKHINYAGDNGIVKFDTNYQQQETAWLKHRKAIDQDVVMWLENKRVKQALGHDYEQPKETIRILKDDPVKLGDFLRAVIARIVATEKLLGMGAKGPATLEWVIKLNQLPVGHAEKWIERGLMTPFDLAKEAGFKAGSDGQVKGDPLSQIYDAMTGTKGVFSARSDAAQLIASQTALSVQGLLNAQASTMARMTQLVYEPKLAKLLPGVTISTAELDSARIMWAKVDAVWNHMFTGNRTFVGRVKIPANKVLDAISSGGLAGVAATDRLLLLKSKTANASTKTTSVSAAARQRLNSARVSQAAIGREISMPVIFDESLWKEFENLPGKKITLIPDSVLGDLKSPPRQVNEVLAYSLFKIHDDKGLKRALFEPGHRMTGGMLGMAGLLQGYVALQACQSLLKGTANNAELVDATMNLVGGFTAIGAAATEIIAMAKEPHIASMGNSVARQLIVPARLRLAAGVAGAAGAGFDAVTSFAKWSNKSGAGQKDASDAYLTAGFLYAGSLAASGFGSYITYRAATAAVLNVAAPRLLGGAVAAGLGLSLTGVGIVLAIAGLGWSLYAIHMEDDENESFLKRGFFGDKSNQRDYPQFAHVGEQVLAFNSLAVGLKATLEWADRWGPEQITAKLLVAQWGEGQIITYTLEALPPSGKSGPAPLILSQGSIKATPGDDKPKVLKAVSAAANVVEAEQQGNDSTTYELSIKAMLDQEATFTRARFSFKYWESEKAMLGNEPATAADSLVVLD